MKLELLDAYNIRARLSASILLLAPIAITLFFVFEEVHSFASSSVILFVLLALTNYVPIMQRTICKTRKPRPNYAAQLLYVDDNTIHNELKKRYYTKLSKLDSSFACFENPDNSRAFKKTCNSAVAYLVNRTRDNHLVQEENINYGFCKNLLACKRAGIILCSICGLFAMVFSFLRFGSFPAIPVQHYLAIASDALLLLFWIFCATEKALKQAAICYAKVLISAIDTLK